MPPPRPKLTRAEGSVVIIMHDRSREIIDPSVATMPVWSTSGLRRPSQTLLPPSARRREVSFVKGALHPAKDRLSGELRDFVCGFLHMDYSFHDLIIPRYVYPQRKPWVFS